MQSEKNQRPSDLAYYAGLGDYWDESLGTTVDKLRSFTKFVPTGDLARFIARYEIFRKVVGIHGAVIECGVHLGGGLASWLAFSTILEPINHVRRIVGFDTFSGFSDISSRDRSSESTGEARAGGLAAPAREDIERAVALADMFRPLGHIPKVELQEGDATQTIPAYVANNPHLTVALLYLDFDVYQPTKVALEQFRRRMPKGAVIAFDELYNSQWPGETEAVHDVLGLDTLHIERFPFHPQISFAVLD
ncbi:dTDP-6-deoxy-L-hexose 3-O-methyltransferase [Mycobacterium sp. 1423905.2]|nr:dTDP-6-deoxy-L-hexose 3-O-methyltransferase [Mycobacterium sp. 1423905.2]